MGANPVAVRVAKERGSLTPPKTILNAPTKLMREEGYGANYAYDHDQPDAFSGQNYWPDALGRQRFYDPPERGFERELRERQPRARFHQLELSDATACGRAVDAPRVGSRAPDRRCHNDASTDGAPSRDPRRF